jgi:hypothetical protein
LTPKPDTKAIRERAERATAAPWEHGELWRDEVEITGAIGEVAILRSMNQAQSAVDGMHADAQFIAHAREDIPALLDALEAAWGRARELEEALRMIQASDGWTSAYDIATAALDGTPKERTSE